MIVILEGVNRVGKTTLADRLEQFGYMRFKDNSINEIPEEIDRQSYCRGGLNGMVNMLKFVPESTNLVFDRFHLTELAYGFVERSYVADYFLEIDKRLKEMGVLLVQMWDNIEKVNERAGKDMGPLSTMMGLAYQMSSLRKTKYNLNQPIGELMRWIKDETQQLTLNIGEVVTKTDLENSGVASEN